MQEIFYPNKRKYSGPFLLSSKDIEGLNEMSNYIEQVFDESEVNNSKKEYNVQKEFQVKLASNSIYKNKELIEIFKHPEFNQDTISSISLNITAGNNKFKLFLNEDINYSCSSKDQTLVNETLYEVDKWVEIIKPNPIITQWVKYSGFFILVLIFSILLLIPDSNENIRHEIYKETIIKQAHELIDDTISPKNQNKAIETILKLTSDYYDVNYNVNINGWERVPNKKFKFAIIIICVILMFAPSTSFEFGKGKKKYRFWKFWIKFIFITIPTTIIIPIILNKFNL
jgi:hypothetical protein